MADDATSVRFDVLVTADRTASGEDGSLPPRPSGQRVDEVRRWLIARGAECHPTGFGVACTMPRSVAEALFGSTATAPGTELTVPAPIAHLVDQITVPAEPEHF